MTRPSFHTTLKTHNLSLAHGERVVARGISITLKAGAITVLRGANGSGKTTLLRTLAGLREAAAGSISLNDAAQHTDAADRRCYSVFFGHDNAIKAALTVEENLRFWTALYGGEESGRERALAALDLTDLRHRRVETLSAGQKRRAGLCRVLLSGKPLWFLDEPTASMDAATISRFQEIVAAHQQSGGSIFVATHDPLQFEDVQTLELAAPV